MVVSSCFAGSIGRLAGQFLGLGTADWAMRRPYRYDTQQNSVKVFKEVFREALKKL